jgi:hypothetical protein
MTSSSMMMSIDEMTDGREKGDHIVDTVWPCCQRMESISFAFNIVFWTKIIVLEYSLHSHIDKNSEMDSWSNG